MARTLHPENVLASAKDKKKQKEKKRRLKHGTGAKREARKLIGCTRRNGVETFGDKKSSFKTLIPKAAFRRLAVELLASQGDPETPHPRPSFGDCNPSELF